MAAIRQRLQKCGASSSCSCSATSARRLTGATVAPPSRPRDTLPTSRCSRVCSCCTPRSLSARARRAGSSSLALHAVTRLLAPVRRYVCAWSSRVLRSRCRCQTFRTVASFLPVFFKKTGRVLSRYAVGTDRLSYPSICYASTHQNRS